MRLETNIKLMAAILVLIVAAYGCGVYTLNPKGKSDVSTIAVEPFENKTAEFGLADRLTEVIVDALIVDGNLKIAPVSGADVVLIGTLIGYQRVVEKFDENDRVQQYKVIMDFELTLRNPRDQSDIWTQKVRQEGIYDANTQTEEDGQRAAGVRLVEVIINKTTKSW